jgi:hypothetical protein
MLPLEGEPLEPQNIGFGIGAFSAAHLALNRATESLALCVGIGPGGGAGGGNSPTGLGTGFG